MLPATAVPERAVEGSVRRMLSLVVANEDTVGLIVAIGDAVVVVVIVVVDIVVVMVDMVVVVVDVVVVVVVVVVVDVMVVVEVDVVVVVVAATKQPNAYFTPS